MTSDAKSKFVAIVFLTVLLVISLPLISSSGRRNVADVMQDGFYTAEAAEFDNYGWKEYITIYVSGNAIVTVDYNAKNASGFIKSWDMEYMRSMNATDGTYPNKYTREYAKMLLGFQNPDYVDAITGATHSHSTFQMLARAAMDQARAGDANVAYVDLTASHQ